ncbi:hypothetical protein HBB16_13085 [Pseudonocardia sp. MCCB 268]|nr:hypothetical protein [Pseudonocardia cytotoxica]
MTENRSAWSRCFLRLLSGRRHELGAAPRSAVLTGSGGRCRRGRGGCC